jgi:hypothetical protein
MNATTLPHTHARNNLSVSLAALLVGAALSAGVIALADTDEPISPPAKIVVLDAPSSPDQAVEGKDEAAIANAISPDLELRGSKASATATPPSAAAPESDDSLPAGPRGLASSLANR